MLVSFSVPTGGQDPLRLYERTAGWRRFYWERPLHRTRIVGVGEAWVLEPASPEPFREARAGLSIVARNVISSPSDPAPIAFAVFAFDSSRGPSDVWDGLPPNRIVVPRAVLVERNGQSTLTLNVLVDHSGDEAVGETRREAGAIWSLLRDASVSALMDSRETLAQTAGAATEVPPHQGWVAAVTAATQEIERGRLQKVVLARRLDLQLAAPADIGAVIRRLRSRHPEAALMACAYEGKTFLCASPETLVRVSDGTARVSCLAGSSPRYPTEAEDRESALALLRSEKDLREHQLVVDYVEQRLATICDGIETGPTEVLSLRNVHHLSAPVTGALKAGMTVLDAAGLLHPTPAVCGTPIDAARDFIRATEPFDRGWYAGAMGWLNLSGEGDLSVALRSALIESDRAHLYAGCGLVAGSDPDSEWEESRLKLRPMLDALSRRES